ncbi:MAG TPA: cysteine desulfurase [Chloroflexota bacterium]|nr:cysteine desulfurase [Chloroflexota bacterium]
MNVAQIRKDFPILEREVNGKRLVYLDSAATSQKPVQVIDALDRYYRTYNANVHRGVYSISEEATEAYEGARDKVQAFVGAERRESIVFVRNTTEAINLVAYTWGRQNIGQGDEIVLSELEHHSNLVPWQILAAEKGAVLKHIAVREDGTLDMDQARQLIGERTKLVAVSHMSNVLGTINPVKELAELAHKAGAVILLDGAQSVPHMPVNVQELDCDFLAASGHKMLAPTGIGFLYGKIELLEAMPPFMGGGDMIRQVWLDRSTYNELPWKFEAGTPNVADAIGLGVAVDYLQAIGMEAIREHEEQLTAYALGTLGELPQVDVHGPRNPEIRGGAISFCYGDVHPHDLAQILDGDGVCIRAGHHCCHPLMRKLGVAATARASFYLYNTEDEIDTLVKSLTKAGELFGVPA